MSGAAQSFLLALSALFSIVNPIGTALIFSQVTADRTHEERRELAQRIAIYASLVMLGALWGGAYILSFFGVSLEALRIAGGFVVAWNAWALLNAPSSTRSARRSRGRTPKGWRTWRSFPSPCPSPRGPARSRSPSRSAPTCRSERRGPCRSVLGASAAAIIIAIMVWVAYAWADRLVALLGRAQARIVTRLSAFLLLCIGVQIALNGIQDFARQI